MIIMRRQEGGQIRYVNIPWRRKCGAGMKAVKCCLIIHAVDTLDLTKIPHDHIFLHGEPRSRQINVGDASSLSYVWNSVSSSGSRWIIRRECLSSFLIFRGSHACLDEKIKKLNFLCILLRGGGELFVVFSPDRVYRF